MSSSAVPQVVIFLTRPLLTTSASLDTIVDAQSILNARLPESSATLLLSTTSVPPDAVLAASIGCAISWTDWFAALGGAPGRDILLFYGPGYFNVRFGDGPVREIWTEEMQGIVSGGISRLRRASLPPELTPAADQLQVTINAGTFARDRRLRARLKANAVLPSPPPLTSIHGSDSESDCSTIRSYCTVLNSGNDAHLAPLIVDANSFSSAPAARRTFPRQVHRGIEQQASITNPAPPPTIPAVESWTLPSVFRASSGWGSSRPADISYRQLPSAQMLSSSYHAPPHQSAGWGSTTAYQAPFTSSLRPSPPSAPVGLGSTAWLDQTPSMTQLYHRGRDWLFPTLPPSTISLSSNPRTTTTTTRRYSYQDQRGARLARVPRVVPGRRSSCVVLPS
ncbi:hypothetical protein FB45DRAFT_1036620 [Roridomyces roridus]|uniref:Uncharacterized protein n=1 Tax=Roridomyces roridus TaxID=1738132 RepID=A0AAD7B8B1_9AGAR|nr:hypothetical protein FB45DRAFT_1036620 [Roridomyces roridus]